MNRWSRMLSVAVLVGVMGAAIMLSAPGAAAQATAAAKKELTLDRLFSPPFLGGRTTQGIEWAPDGKRFSYLERKNSDIELWAMDAATGERKVLVNAETLKSVTQPEKAKTTQATGLGRVQADNYQWAPDSGSLLFIGTSSMVLLDLKTMRATPVVSSEAEIEDPKFSPDGKWISFSRNANLFAVNLASGETKTLTTGGSEEVLKGKLDWVYPEELDTRTAYWWSPDSSKIAYYEMDERPVTRYPIMDMSSPTGGTEYTRYPQAGEANPIVRVGVVPVTGGETKWMDTGANTDVYLARVNWLPDSKRVAIQRLNRGQNQLDLLFCDVSTGASTTALTETDKYWINISDDLYFFSDNKRFLWSSERTGYRHFYIYDNFGKQMMQLTSGDWGISDLGGFGPGAANHPAVDEKHGYIYFITNKDDVRETNLYRVSIKRQESDADHEKCRQQYGENLAGPCFVRQRLFQRERTDTPGSVPDGRDADRRDQRRQGSGAGGIQPYSGGICGSDRRRWDQAKRFDHQAGEFRRSEEISGADQCVRRTACADGAERLGRTELFVARSSGAEGLHYFHAG